MECTKDVPNKASTNTNIKQALFVGSSAELHKMLKDKKDVQVKEDEDIKKVNDE